MRARWVIFAAAMAAAISGQALAADSSDTTTVQGLVIRGRLSHEVQGLIITPSRLCLEPRKPPDPDVPPPKLVSSFPADGAVVKPGIMVLRLTFDLPMACAGLLEPVFLVDNPCPAPLIDPVISKDRRTFMTICLVQPNGRYGVWLDLSATRRWTSLAGHRLSPHQISFSTSSGAKVRTLKDAIAEDPFLRAMVGEELDAVAPAASTVAEKVPAAAAAPAPAVAVQAPETVASAQPSTPVAPVTVTAPLKASDLARSRSFIDAYGAPTARLDRYARWNDPPCVAVVGLAPAQAAQVKARIWQVARSAGRTVAGAGCQANVEIEFTAQPQALVDQIVQKTPQVLGYQPGAEAKALKTMTRPIQAWYMTASRGGSNALGMASAMAGPPKPGLAAPDPGTTTSAQRFHAADHPPGAHAGLDDPATSETLDDSSRGSGAGCTAQASTCQSVFRNVLVVIDVGKVQDRSIQSLTDYVAMLALSQPRSLDGCLSLASIVDLLAPMPCPGRDAPDGLTPADTAYLAALYASDPLANRTMQQSVMSERMAGALVKAAPPADRP